MASIERETESALTVTHICHCARIPVGHVLIERRCGIKHCKTEGATKTKKDQPTTNKNTRLKLQNVSEL